MRVIKHERNHPFVLKLGDLPGLKNLTNDQKVLGYEIHACACGLSSHKPLCDGSHMKAQNEKEGAVCIYSKEGIRKELNASDVNEEIVNLPNEYE